MQFFHCLCVTLCVLRSIHVGIRGNESKENRGAFATLVGHIIKITYIENTTIRYEHS